MDEKNDNGFSKGQFAFSPPKREKYLELIANGAGRTRAAQQVGTSRCTVRKFAKANPEFAVLLAEAEMALIDKVEGALYRNAIENLNHSSIVFVLKNRRPKKWKDDKIPPVVQPQMTSSEILRELTKLLKENEDKRLD